MPTPEDEIKLAFEAAIKKADPTQNVRGETLPYSENEKRLALDHLVQVAIVTK
jgi:hypothetical protein